MTGDPWLVEAVRFFRSMDFFLEHNDLANEALAAHLAGLYRDEWGHPFDHSAPLSDLLILRYSKHRVWWEDTEADVGSGNDVYIETLTDWATISRGAFSITQVHETWVADDGPIIVTFEINGQSGQVRPRYLDDYIDMGIIPKLNKYIASTGYELAVYDFFDQTAFVTVLTKDEKQRLKSKRAWHFAVFE